MGGNHLLRRYERPARAWLCGCLHKYGHYGTSGDGSFALGHPDKLVDFGYRAVHEMTVKAKAIVAAFYGECPQDRILERLLDWRQTGADGSATFPVRF
jgi:Tannase and feruloyl esterase